MNTLSLEDRGMVRASTNDGIKLSGTRGNRLVLVNTFTAGVKISVFNVQGRLLARTELGTHESWDCGSMKSTGAVFIVRASAGKVVQTLCMSGIKRL